MIRRLGRLYLIGIFFALLAGAASAQDGLDTGNTAWLLVSTALVLFMTIPGLSLFYAGLVRSKNVLSVMMQCFAITAIMSLLWWAYGYSFAFSGYGQFLGNGGRIFLNGLSVDSISELASTIPETVFVMFQMTFAIITPALIVGAFAERMKFSAMLAFLVIWFTVCYVPVCHWVWGDGGWLKMLDVKDFAGGTVVHINAGVAGLVAAIVLGPRSGYPRVPMPPNSMVLSVVGAGMLWVGWFGFNAGSAVAADNAAGMAMLVTHLATAAAAVTWAAIEWKKHGKPSALGIITGAVAGLVTITPAAGSVGPAGAVAMGVISSSICFYTATVLKMKIGYDDSLDVFGVHGVGGCVGAILTGVFVAPALGGLGDEGMNVFLQVGKQALGVVVTLVYSGVLTFVILKLVNGVMGLRVTEEAETMGLDVALHGERGFDL